MTYAIIKVGGKQYRVREGQRLLVDRLHEDDGATITPPVLLVGGDGAPVLDTSGVKVTARVVGAVKGPKIRIGKYKKRTGYRRHTGFRASLTQIEIESIGGKAKASSKPKAETATPKAKPEATAEPTQAETPEASAAPAGYADMTIADLKAATGGWTADELRAALAFEHANANRKGAIAALESALAQKEGDA